jgi:uncharacterized phiE125 gp8 family phage protein
MSVQMEPVGQAVLDAALPELKDWLRMETGADDAALRRLLGAALGCAEDFCGQTILQRAGIEIVRADGRWRRLLATPLVSIGAALRLGSDGSASALGLAEYAIDRDPCGDAFLRLTGGAAATVELHLVAGIAASWAGLPEALRHGILRLAAHMFAEREAESPPAIVAALWRPWRRMRLA